MVETLPDSDAKPMMNRALRIVHDALYTIVTGAHSNQQIVHFQQFCGVQPDGTTKNKMLKVFFRTASACGEEIFSLMPLMIWFAYPLSPSFVTNFVFLLLGGQIVKDVFKLPRPSADGTGILKLGDQHFETEYGFPSTHTMTGFLPFSVVLCLLRHGTTIGNGVWVACLIYILSIALSRLYLGVHSVVDISAGLILGASLTVALHFFGDDYIDHMIYYRFEGISIFIAATSVFLLFYPRPRPWRAGFGTSAQILGSWIGGAASMWYLQHVQPELLLIMQHNSFIKEVQHPFLPSANSSKLFEYQWNFSRKSLSILLVSLGWVGISKFLIKFLAVKFFSFLAERVVYFRPHPLEKIDSLGNVVPISKAYFVEVPVRYNISYYVSLVLIILSNMIIFIWILLFSCDIIESVCCINSFLYPIFFFFFCGSDSSTTASLAGRSWSSAL
jgi:hypothetical protein